MIINAAIIAAALSLSGAVRAQGQNATTPADPPANTDVQKDRRQIQQSLANALRFFRVSLSVLGKLNRLVRLRSGDDSERH